MLIQESEGDFIYILLYFILYTGTVTQINNIEDLTYRFEDNDNLDNDPNIDAEFWLKLKLFIQSIDFVERLIGLFLKCRYFSDSGMLSTEMNSLILDNSTSRKKKRFETLF